MSRTGHIGSLRHRISVEQPVDVADGAGGFDRSWQVVAEMWASATPVIAPEQGIDEQVLDQGRMRFAIRWRADVTAAMRVIHAGRIFNIEAIVDLEQRGRDLILETREARP